MEGQEAKPFNREEDGVTLPMETEGMKEGREGFHDQQHAKRGAGPDGESHKDGDERILGTWFPAEHKDSLPEDLWLEMRMVGWGR